MTRSPTSFGGPGFTASKASTMTDTDTNIAHFHRHSIFDQAPKIHMVADFAKIEAFVKPSDLAKDWSGDEAAGPFYFRKAPEIVVKRGDDRWLDPKRGRIGTGAISLVAHVLNEPPYMVAPRLAEFAAIRDGVPADNFRTPMSCEESSAQDKTVKVGWAQ